jgi:allophanate hydrolase subunit 1
MSSSEAAVIAHKAASAAIYGGSGTAMYFGLSPGEWQVLGVLGGLIFAAAGFVTNLYFKAAHLELARAKAKADQEAQ